MEAFDPMTETFDSPAGKQEYCPNCGLPVSDEFFLVDDGTTCSDCYMNEDCPARCNEPHPEPRDRYYDSLEDYTCPATGTRFFRCADCGEDVPYARWADSYWRSAPGNPRHSRMVCDACVEQYGSCDECGEGVFMDDLIYSEVTDSDLCANCYADVDGAVASTVSRDHRWLDPVTEQWFFAPRPGCLVAA